MSASTAFDPLGPLPGGRLAIEASAGTGKTFTLSTLAARYITEHGTGVGELLVVTFTRAAAAELKDRIRARLVQFAQVLGTSEPPGDPLLAAVHAVDRELRHQRTLQALAEFDAATITTIHGFAQQVLGTLGSSVPTDPDAVLIDDATSLVAQVATDRLVAAAVDDTTDVALLPSLDDLCWAAQQALGNPGALLVPSDRPDESSPAAAMVRHLVDDVITTVEQRRRQAASLSFDDLLARLRDVLADEHAGPAARDALRRRYTVALIDEFQDTDAVQWDIFNQLFGRPDDTATHASTAMVLVGDPKQAIYAFRGANIHTYLRAARADGTEQRSLATNWRSDAPVLAGIDALLTGATFGVADIAFQPVEAAEKNRDRCISSRDDKPIPAVSLRLLTGPNVVSRTSSKLTATVEPATTAIFDDLAVYLRDLLDTAQLPDPNGPGTRALVPQDIAVLVNTNAQSLQVREALSQLGIPAVIARGDNVLSSAAAMHWHWLLTALTRPADGRRARAAALSWFFGWDTDRVRATDDLIEVQERLVTWAHTLSTRGVAAFLGQVRAESGVAARVLGQANGERHITDLDHVAELLTLTVPRFASPSTLLATFESLTAGSADGDADADLSARRVESEASAVQIMTTFVAKGLEFGVVCCPMQWHEGNAKVTFKGRDQLVYWNEATQHRTIDVAPKTKWSGETSYDERLALAAAEATGTDLRLLYVAFTRAIHHLVVWWVPTAGNTKAGLTRVLFARDREGRIDPELFGAPEVPHRHPDDVLDALAPVVAAANGHLRAVVIDTPNDDAARPERWRGRPPAGTEALQVTAFDRSLPRTAGRWSFTAITSRARDELADLFDPYDSSHGDAGAADEQLHDTRPAEPPPAGVAPPPDEATLPLASIAGGAGFGTLVHDVLERVDFTSPTLAADLAHTVRERLEWNPWPIDVDHLVSGLMATVNSPLGPLFRHTTLRQLDPSNRVNELVFDLRVGSATHPGTDAALGAVLLEHLGHDDPLRPWAERLATGPFSVTLTGHLTGSIDLLARVRRADPSQPDQFVVVDYKTNRVVPTGTTPNASHFTPASLTHEMTEANYALQAVLYSVAVHRYLRYRLAHYRPELHLGGTAYLFVRGMQGPTTPVHNGAPNGVFSWTPPPAMISELSDVLDGQRRAPTGAGR
jgi:exodeoxyribonuclease V beta subunit